MRQTALIVLMAQTGSFVPAKEAVIGLVDGIFTRVGASDDLAAGQSTFMVEMTEVASILKEATADSLVIFDEIGRGTSTYDGMSIARAVLEFVADPQTLGARTLFATHYHELTEIEKERPGIRNYSVAVKKRGDAVAFLRKIVPGPTDESYGVEVAKLAGVPDRVVTRAKDILADLENNGLPTPPAPRSEKKVRRSEKGDALLERLRRIEVDALTPIEALQILYELCREAKEEPKEPEKENAQMRFYGER